MQFPVCERNEYRADTGHVTYHYRGKYRSAARWLYVHDPGTRSSQRSQVAEL